MIRLAKGIYRGQIHIQANLGLPQHRMVHDERWNLTLHMLRLLEHKRLWWITKQDHSTACCKLTQNQLNPNKVVQVLTPIDAWHHIWILPLHQCRLQTSEYWQEPSKNCSVSAARIMKANTKNIYQGDMQIKNEVKELVHQKLQNAVQPLLPTQTPVKQTQLAFWHKLIYMNLSC